MGVEMGFGLGVSNGALLFSLYIRREMKIICEYGSSHAGQVCLCVCLSV